MTELELRQNVVNIAMGWHGRNEADGSFREILNVYNVCARRRGLYIMTDRDPWCAAFVTAVGEACGLSDTILPECHCERMIALYKRAGRWVEDDAYNARIGDLVMYDWQDSGSGDCTGEADHVGLIVSVTSFGYVVIEGNSSDAVQTRIIPLNGRYIRGFCLPDYAAAAEKSVGQQPVSESDTESDPAQEMPADRSTVNPPMLRRGSRGLSVTAMQGILIARGYDCGPDGADGDFGSNTEAALRRFQSANNLEVDGICGPASWRSLLGLMQ